MHSLCVLLVKCCVILDIVCPLVICQLIITYFGYERRILALNQNLSVAPCDNFKNTTFSSCKKSTTKSKNILKTIQNERFNWQNYRTEIETPPISATRGFDPWTRVLEEFFISFLGGRKANAAVKSSSVNTLLRSTT
jgi:hypothetical protein